MGRTAVVWTDEMVSLLQEKAPSSTYAQLMELFGVSSTPLRKKMKELGLTTKCKQKSPYVIDTVPMGHEEVNRIFQTVAGGKRKRLAYLMGTRYPHNVAYILQPGHVISPTTATLLRRLAHAHKTMGPEAFEEYIQLTSRPV